MKLRLLDLLACPRCGADLELCDGSPADDEVLDGTLACASCDGAFPVTAGVPRFVEQLGEIEQRTADAFSFEWNRYHELADRYRQQFLDWLSPVEPGFFRDKVVLEGGCGKGRHSTLAASFGARDVVAIDLGESVRAAHANSRPYPNVHVVQADLNRPPLKPVFDYAFSIGVLHHMPDPAAGFRALVSRVRPGGHVSAWVYGREGNGWIVRLVTPVRERVTARMRHEPLDLLSGALTVPLYAATRISRLVHGRLGVSLPYGDYLTYIGDFPFREQRSIVFDHLAAPISFYLRRDEFAGWFAAEGLADVTITRHNRNSWRGFARKPAVPNAGSA